MAAKLPDLFLDQIHPHAAARNFSHFVNGRKSRFENKPEDRFLIERFPLGNHSEALGFGENPLRVHAASIVRDFDRDLAGILHGLQTDDSLLGFANPPSLIGRFEARDPQRYGSYA